MTANDQMKLALPSISQFYTNKTVAITGATGFLGQCVVEKLLRTCPQVKKIFILLRNKKNLTVNERLDLWFKLPIFDKLRTMQPNFERKIQSIYCNLERDNLDLDKDSIELIQNEVNIFIHCAATLRFDQHLRLAFRMNSLAVYFIVRLCKRIKNFSCLVHLSTAYSYCNYKQIDEGVFPTGWNFDKLKDAMEWMSDEMITKITPDILGDRPNTYTLTKAIGEEILIKEGAGLPMCIVRPSIIGACMNEPLPGWCANLNGATGIIVAYGKGLLHSLNMSTHLNLDIIPADFVVNVVVASAWKTGLLHQSEEELPMLNEFTSVSKPEHDPEISRRTRVPIYQVVVGENNPLRAQQWSELLHDSFSAYPFDKVMTAPSLHLVSNKFLYRLQAFVMQYLPAYIFDKGMSVFGQKSTLLRYNQLIDDNVSVLHFFINNQWIWENKSVLRLHSDMSEEDKRTFTPIAHTIDWSKYVRHYAIGTKKYIVKEDTKGYPEARRRMWRVRMLGYCFQGLLLMISWRLLVSQTSSARNLWHLFISLLFKFFNYISSIRFSVR